MKPDQQLDTLLRETLAAAQHRERSAFDEVSQGRSEIVIFGAGRLGHKVRAGLVGAGLQPVAFADNNVRLWGSTVDGLAVLSPQEAAAKYSSNATFVVAVWHPSSTPLMCTLITQVRQLGCRVAPFPLLFWKYADTFLPYFFWALPSNLLPGKTNIVEAFDLLGDDLSRQTFIAQVQLRLRADFDCAASPAPGAQYFPGLFSLSPQECFVDCGAYIGDTIQSFISQTENSFRKVIAFEADPSVIAQLEAFMLDVGERGILRKAAVGAVNSQVRFSGDGIGGGRVTGTVSSNVNLHFEDTRKLLTDMSYDGGAREDEVPCVRLDEALATEQPSFIKMDIEGAELQALEGARGVIQRHRPVLAVCGYHAPDHLWRIPISLKALAPDSLVFVRSHCVDGLDTVWYSIPRERMTQTVAVSMSGLAGRNKPHLRTQGSVS